MMSPFSRACDHQPNTVPACLLFLRRTSGAAQIEYAVMMLVVIGLAAVLAEAVALTPIHHRVIAAMNQSHDQQAAQGQDRSSEPGCDVAHVLSDYEIKASDAKFFWQAVAIGLFILVIVKSVFVCYQLRKRRRALEAQLKKRKRLISPESIFKKRQELYHVVLNQLDVLFAGGFQACHLMSTKIQTVRESTSIDVLKKKMESCDLHHLLVVDRNDRLSGVISVGDVNKGEGVNASEIMTRNPCAVAANSKLMPAITLMLERRVGCLPVVSDENKIQGVITGTDLAIFVQSLMQLFLQWESVSQVSMIREAASINVAVRGS